MMDWGGGRGGVDGWMMDDRQTDGGKLTVGAENNKTNVVKGIWMKCKGYTRILCTMFATFLYLKLFQNKKI